MKTFILLSTLCAITTFAQDAILPPLPPWNGASRALVAPKGDKWITPAEAGELRTTPRYEETVAWLRKLVTAAPELEMISIGTSPEGRDIWMVIASKEKRFTPEALRKSGKPTILAHGGIHSGEIDGKDAGMMLLRDMTVRGTKRDLLDRANLLFVPILNVDGHERVSRFSRINQRGPEESGWRTNAQNLNLNRDFAKLDTPEVQSIVRALDVWEPDLYVDIHVTDGADYQYDITWGHNGTDAYSPAIVAWLDRALNPAVTRDLARMGHIPGPLAVAGFNPSNLDEGITAWTAGPRFSNAYGDARHIPSILVENHSLKPYDQRVLGTYVLLESMLRTIAASRDDVKKAIASDRARRPKEIPPRLGPERESRDIRVQGVRVEAVVLAGIRYGANRLDGKTVHRARSLSNARQANRHRHATEGLLDSCRVE